MIPRKTFPVWIIYKAPIMEDRPIVEARERSIPPNIRIGAIPDARMQRIADCTSRFLMFRAVKKFGTKMLIRTNANNATAITTLLVSLEMIVFRKIFSAFRLAIIAPKMMPGGKYHPAIIFSNY